MELPTRARVAIRRLHVMLGHKPQSVLLNILRGAKASQEYITAAKLYRCDTCLETKEPTRPHPAAPPGEYTFNHEVYVDVFEIHDS